MVGLRLLTPKLLTERRRYEKGKGEGRGERRNEEEKNRGRDRVQKNKAGWGAEMWNRGRVKREEGEEEGIE